MARTGRPKSDNPKNNLIGLKLTEYASRHGMTITEMLQRGIELQYEMEQTSK